MKFTKGQSGNPSGKKPGTLNKRTQLAKLFDVHAEALINKCVEMALSGDVNALRLAIERVVPRAKDNPVYVDLPDKLTVSTLKDTFEKILRSVGNGEVTPEQAKTIFDIVKGYGDYVQIEELHNRYKVLAQKVVDMRKKPGWDIGVNHDETK